jgi:hypothetical protein
MSEGNAGPSQTSTGAGLQIPSIALPRGGGAIRGIGEKFAANPVTGTGGLTVPISIVFDIRNPQRAPGLTNRRAQPIGAWRLPLNHNDCG